MSMAITAGVVIATGTYSAVNQYQAGKQSKALSKQQAEQQKKEAKAAITQSFRDQSEFLGNQATQFAKSGVLLEGTPLDVLESTRKEFQRQRKVIEETGSAQAAASLQQGRIAFNQGVAGGVATIGSTVSSVAGISTKRSG